MTHQIDVKFIAKSDHDARILIKNNTKQPISLKLPEAFAGVPVLAQFGGGGGGGGIAAAVVVDSAAVAAAGSSRASAVAVVAADWRWRRRRRWWPFSVPPEETAKIDVAVVCLDHGLRDPNSAAAYKIVPANEFLEDRPAVVELLKAFGRGELQHGAAQAAAWHLNSDLSWDQLAAKLQGTRRSPSRPPYFTAAEIRAGMAYANEATRLAEANADEYAREKQARAEKAAKAKTESSDARSTTDTDSNEPPATTQSTESTDKKS